MLKRYRDVGTLSFPHVHIDLSDGYMTLVQ